MNPNVRVAVLGATGFAGRAVIEELAERGIATVGTSRSRQAIDSVVRKVRQRSLFKDVDGEALDITDRGALRVLLAQSAVVVNCVGPYLRNGEDVVRAAIETRTPYIDVASEQEFYRRVHKLSSRAVAEGCFVGVGLGAYPGLSGLLLRRLLHAVPEALSAEIMLAMTPGSDEGGTAQVLSAILEMNFPLEELHSGRLVPIPIGAAKVWTLPAPFGRTRLLRWPQLEVLACADLGVVASATSHVTLGRKAPSRLLIRLIQLLAPHRRPWAYRLLTRLVQRRTHVRAAPPGSISQAVVRVTVHARTQSRSAHLALPTAGATAWLPAALCQRLLADADYGTRHAGVHTALDLIDMDPVLELALESGATLDLQTSG